MIRFFGSHNNKHIQRLHDLDMRLELVLFTRMTLILKSLINIIFGINFMSQCVPAVKTKWYVEALQLLPTHCNLLITLDVSFDM